MCDPVDELTISQMVSELLLCAGNITFCRISAAFVWKGPASVHRSSSGCVHTFTGRQHWDQIPTFNPKVELMHNSSSESWHCCPTAAQTSCYVKQWGKSVFSVSWLYLLSDKCLSVCLLGHWMLHIMWDLLICVYNVWLKQGFVSLCVSVIPGRIVCMIWLQPCYYKWNCDRTELLLVCFAVFCLCTYLHTSARDIRFSCIKPKRGSAVFFIACGRGVKSLCSCVCDMVRNKKNAVFNGSSPREGYFRLVCGWVLCGCQTDRG